ncbi:MAG: crossover junction endodeoxyribonuclease RuvC [Chloroflexi bacterium]|nr:crossover junction endodeoxyribonuclease RuvC [Chloroflexota bacterium]
MRIIGIDPGTLVMGYGIIEDEPALVDFGVLVCPKHSHIGERLHFLYRGLSGIIAECKPDVMAVEEPFVALNVRSALAIGRAQAIALLAAASAGIPSFEYSPAQVKQAVSSYGSSGKEQVQRMVQLQLQLAEPPEPDDAADALAVAICHLQHSHLDRLAKGNSR